MEASMDRAIRLTNAAKIGIVLAFTSVLATANAQSIPGALPESAKALSQGEWPAYAGTYAAARYSPLAQIDRDNAKNLHIAWALEVAGHNGLGAQARLRSERDE
jgi:glucose dehydrogenase